MITVKNIVIAILIIIVGILLIRGCNDRNAKDKLEQRLNLEQSNQDSLKNVFNSKTQQWESSRQALVANEKELTKFLNDKNTELAELKKSKKASVGVIIKTETKIDTVVKNVPVPVGGDNSIRRAVIENKFYKANVVSTVDTTSLSIKMWSKAKYSIGKDYRVTATYDNPYISVTEMDAFYVRPVVKKKNWKFLVGGVLGGLAVYGIAK